MGAGYVKTHRESMEHAVFDDPWLWKVFSWCVMRANFRDSNTSSGLVKRGSFTTGRIRAADELKMSPSRVYRLLHKLEDLGSIKIDANSGWTTVTVCNYDTYQSDDPSERTADEQPADSQRTADEQPADTRRRNQEGKKGRSNTGPFVPPTVEEVAAYCRERGNNIDAEYFVNRYAAVDWVVGKAKTKMKCWKSTIHTWERNNYSSGRTTDLPQNSPIVKKFPPVNITNAAHP